MLQNKQCLRDSLCTMMSQVMLFANRIMLNILKRELQKFYQRGYIVFLGDLWNAMKKRSTKFRCIGTLCFGALGFGGAVVRALAFHL